MNVVCGQCGTGYEFDDALVSERGTTVRCMHCGHQFRVHPERAKSGGPERWIVRKASGEEYIFRSLSELQRAIAQRRVVISDSMSRDAVHFRPMADLSELESFFGPGQGGGGGQSKSSPGAGGPGRPGDAFPSRASNDPMAITPTAAISVPVPTPRGGFATGATEAVAVKSNVSSGAYRQSGSTTPSGLAHPSSTAAAPHGGIRPGVDARQALAPRLPDADAVRSSEKRGPRDHSKSEFKVPMGAKEPPTHAPTSPTLTSEPDGVGDDRMTPAGSLPRRRRPGRVNPVVEDHTMLAGGISEPSSSHVAAPLAVTPEPRSGGPRWIIALVLLGGLALVAGTVGRDYFERFRENSAPVAQSDTRVDTFLSAGDELYRSGDLEEARAQYEKASALAERDPAVLQRLLKVETTRADVDWLRLRILPKSSPEVARVTASLEERSIKLQRRLEELQKVIGASPAQGTLALVDALRVQGQIAAARTLVQQASGLSNDADSAYVSAMLDVSEVNPNWLSIVSRLKIAVSGERGLGRAQAALVYSLISAGQLEEARQQLEVLAGFKRQSPLLADLQAMLNAAVIAPPVEPRVAAASEDAVAAAGETVGARPEKGGATVASELRSDDPMAEAGAARASGELSKAGKLYSYALSKEPTNVAAMTGLGDVARSQGNADIALSHYGAALRTNPNYGPAILSCADLKWSMGDRAAAVELYRRLGAGAPHRVGDRIAEFEKGAPKLEPPPQASVSPNPEPAPTPNQPIGGAFGPAPEPAATEPQQGTP